MRLTPEKKLYLWEKGSNLAGFLVYGTFVYRTAQSFYDTHRISALLVTIFLLILSYFLIVRPPPKQQNLSLYDWSIAMGGTYLIMFMRPTGGGHDYILAQAMQILGIVIVIWGAISLNKSFGLVAVNRGIKTGGIYKYIRHPLYAGYLVQFTGYWFQNMTMPNTMVLILWMNFEVLRLFAEEKVLSQDPVYAEYMKKTRWRLIPFVF